MFNLWGWIMGCSILCLLVPLEASALSRIGKQIRYGFIRADENDIPFAGELRRIFAYGQVSLTPKMFLAEVFLAVMGFPILGRFIFHSWVEGVIFGGLMAGYAVWWPFHKYKKRKEAMLSEFQFLILLMAMVMKRGGQPDEALRFAAPMVGGPLKHLLDQVINRMKTTDTLADGVHWLAEQTGLVVAKQWANQIVQSDVYHTQTVSRLLGLMAGERKKRRHLAGKRSDRKRWTSLFVATGFVGIPIVFFIGYVSLHNVLTAYNSIHF